MIRGYAICCSARSGSGYLCDLLASTSLLGRPAEYFNADRNWDLAIDYPSDPEGQFDMITQLGVTANGVYGLKVITHQFDHAAATRWAERLPNLSFVHLRRRDLLRQAVSAARARQTEAWSSHRGPSREPAYDAIAIGQQLIALAGERARWSYWFARNDLKPLELIYEDLVADPARAVAAVAALVGVEAAAIDPASSVRRVQADEISEAWRRRFLAESYDLARFD